MQVCEALTLLDQSDAFETLELDLVGSNYLCKDHGHKEDPRSKDPTPAVRASATNLTVADLRARDCFTLDRYRGPIRQRVDLGATTVMRPQLQNL